MDLKHCTQVSRSSSVDELLAALGQTLGVLSTEELYSLLLLCDLSKSNLWQRVHDFFEYIVSRNEQNQGFLSINHFKLLLWYCLGFEAVDEDYFADKLITFDYIATHLVPTFRRAVEENAPSLASTSPDILSLLVA